MKMKGAYLFLQDSQSPESSKTFVDRGRIRTVIFSPRVCSNVDLDLGNLICIYPPWYVHMFYRDNNSDLFHLLNLSCSENELNFPYIESVGNSTA
jgi:hypothetical protein